MDEAADALMTRLGFLLGDKIISGEPGSSYHAQDDGQVISCSFVISNVSENIRKFGVHLKLFFFIFYFKVKLFPACVVTHCLFFFSPQRISPSSSLASSSTSPCSTLQPPAGGEGNIINKHASSNHASVTSPTSTLESRDSGIIGDIL